MRKIMLLNAKGGCGKSTLATNLASYYACTGEIGGDRGLRSAGIEHAMSRAASAGPSADSRHRRVARPGAGAAFHGLRHHGCTGGSPRRGPDGAGAARADGDHPGVAVADRHSRRGAFHTRGIAGRENRAGRDASRGGRQPRARKHLDPEHHGKRAEPHEHFLQHAQYPRSITTSNGFCRACGFRSSPPCGEPAHLVADARGLGIFDLNRSQVTRDTEQWEPLLKWLESKRSIPQTLN